MLRVTPPSNVPVATRLFVFADVERDRRRRERDAESAPGTLNAASSRRRRRDAAHRIGRRDGGDAGAHGGDRLRSLVALAASATPGCSTSR
jgi:hypothetical protein